MRKPFFNGLGRQTDFLLAAGNWKGTPFHPHARAMGVGVDCVQLCAEIYKATGFIEQFAPGEYSMDGGKHLAESQVIAWIEASGRFDLVWEEEPRTNAALGDLLCFRVGKQVHHVGVALNPVKFLHVYRGYTVKESLINDSTWRKRLQRIYRPVTNEIMEPEPAHEEECEHCREERLALAARTNGKMAPLLKHKPCPCLHRTQ